MEEQTQYRDTHDIVTDVAKRPDVVDLEKIQEVNFEEDRLCFYTDLNDDLADRLSKLLTTLHKGKQWHWAAFWRKLEESGYEWTDYVPVDSGGRPMISLGRAHTWRSVDKKFPEDSRIYKNLTYSHYEAVRAIEDSGAHDILEAADRACLSVAELGDIAKGMKGEPKEKEPRIIHFKCEHCGEEIEISEDDFK